MSDRIFIQGEEIRWRENESKRLWKAGYIVGRRNQWLIVRLADGQEREMHPRNVRDLKGT